MSYLLTGARVLTLLFWLTVVGSLFMGLSEPLNSLIPSLGAMVLVAHGLEALLWRKRIQALSDNLPLNIFLVLVFGAFHMASLNLKSLEQNSSD